MVENLFDFSMPDFEAELEFNGNKVLVTKEGEKITIQPIKNSLVDDFKDYVENLDEDIYEETNEVYEKLTGKTLKELNDKLDNNTLTEQDVNEYEAVVRSVATMKVKNLIKEFDLEELF